MTEPAIAVLPDGDEGLEEAVRAGGGRVVDAEHADGIVWAGGGGPKALGAALARSPARWVQLPLAGIERYVEAGVIDARREWTCAKGIYGRACAEHAVALMLAAARRLHDHVRAGRWRGKEAHRDVRRLHGARVVVVGTGGIGAPLPAMLAPFDARVVAVNRSGTPLAGADTTVPVSDLPDALADADFAVVAAALTAATRGLFDAALLARMRSDAWLVNVARGALVDTDALVDALERGVIAGAALDVTDPEPLPDGHPLWAQPNAIITPHVANTWAMALPELRALVERNVRRFGAGEPLEGRVDPDLGY